MVKDVESKKRKGMYHAIIYYIWGTNTDFCPASVAEHGAEKPKKVKKDKVVATEAPPPSDKKRKGTYKERIFIMVAANII